MRGITAAAGPEPRTPNDPEPGSRCPVPESPSALTIPPMEVHLIDGTYELFRHYYAMPSARDARRPRSRARCAASSRRCSA